MNYKKFIEEYNNANDKMKCIHRHITSEYVPYQDKIVQCRKIIDTTCRKTININDSINPDETVAYGATLQAEKLLYNQDQKISNFHILNITPFSLGVSTQNNSEDEELQKQFFDFIFNGGEFAPTNPDFLKILNKIRGN